jgi:mono/diheme cytochrome c family protein
MVLKTSVFLSLLLVAVSCSSGSDETTVANETKPLTQIEAHSVYMINCASCHGEDGKLGSSGAKDLSASKLNDKQIEKIIRKGKNAMPSQEAILETDENIKLVIEHVKSLKK